MSVYSGNTFLGIGYFNTKTDIAVRMLSLQDDVIDPEFFEKRFEASGNERKCFI